MCFIYGRGRTGFVTLRDEADDAHGDGAGGGEEDEAGQDDGATASAF